MSRKSRLNEERQRAREFMAPTSPLARDPGLAKYPVVTTLWELQDAQKAVDDSRERLIAAVAAARAEGHSWTDVGNAIGVSRQAARQRFEGK